MSVSFWQIALVAVLVVLLFGRGRISALMGDVASGIKTFKKGLADEEEAPAGRVRADGDERMGETERSDSKSAAQ